MKRLTVLICLMILIVSLSACGPGNDKYYSIDHFYIKEEGDVFRKAYNELVQDTFNWYRSIEGEEGVYIIHCEQYSKELLKEWKDSGYVNYPRLKSQA